MLPICKNSQLLIHIRNINVTTLLHKYLGDYNEHFTATVFTTIAYTFKRILHLLNKDKRRLTFNIPPYKPQTGNVYVSSYGNLVKPQI